VKCASHMIRMRGAARQSAGGEMGSNIVVLTT
jgi:hypothetical protein